MPLTTVRWRVTLALVVGGALALAMSPLASSLESSRFWGDSLWMGSFRHARLIDDVMRVDAAAIIRDEVTSMVGSEAFAGRGDASVGDNEPSRLQVFATDSASAAYLSAVTDGVRAELESSGIRTSSGMVGRPLAVPVRVVIIAQPRKSTLARFALTGKDASVTRSIVVPRTPIDPCTVVLTIFGSDSARTANEIASAHGVLGPCTFVASFGLPGQALRAHLDSAGWQPAAFARWGERAERAEALRQAWSELAPEGVACLSRADAACEAAWHLTGSAASNDILRADEATAIGPARDVLSLPWFTVRGAALGTRERLLFSDLVQESGVARFGDAWRAEQTWPEFVESLTGESSPAWISRWLARSYRRPVISPLPNSAELAWTLATLVACVLGVLVRPRGRSRTIAAS